MKVTREVKAAFDFVVAYMKLTPADIAECKAEFRANPDWGNEFYPKAAAVIRAASGQQCNEDQFGKRRNRAATADKK